VDVVTFEFENVPAGTAEACEGAAPVRPSPQVLHVAQHRLREKQTLQGFGLPVPGFRAVNSLDDLRAALAELGTPAILKTAASGYDGKGQQRIDSAEGAMAAWEAIEQQTAVLEAFVPFQQEISVIGARSASGEVAFYAPFGNSHAHHILDVSMSPAVVPGRVAETARDIARSALTRLEVVGLLCVEMFVLESGEVLINEVAPRPHNSGHLTLDAHHTSQFEQHVRAVCGLPLGSVQQHTLGAAMANLLGDLWERGTPDWAAALRTHPNLHLHLYGKTEPRARRKMGHLTATAATPEAAAELVQRARAALTAGVRTPA
jgi:5-(carboxyamino)imidazole ribonucleotide synthase